MCACTKQIGHLSTLSSPVVLNITWRKIILLNKFSYIPPPPHIHKSRAPFWTNLDISSSFLSDIHVWPYFIVQLVEQCYLPTLYVVHHSQTYLSDAGTWRSTLSLITLWFISFFTHCFVQPLYITALVKYWYY